MYRNKLYTLVPASALLMLTGCGYNSHSNNIAPQTPQHALQLQVQQNLTSFTHRLNHVPALPLTSVSESNGTSVELYGSKQTYPPVTVTVTMSSHQVIHTQEVGPNVLYINPASDYAIRQFRQDWDKLRPVPVVIWVQTIKDQANALWKQEGYSGDPLPSPYTFYSTACIPQPDSYHFAGKGWANIPGVLKDKEADKWVLFFNGTVKGK